MNRLAEARHDAMSARPTSVLGGGLGPPPDGNTAPSSAGACVDNTRVLDQDAASLIIVGDRWPPALAFAPAR